METTNRTKRRRLGRNEVIENKDFEAEALISEGDTCSSQLKDEKDGMAVRWCSIQHCAYSF